MNQQMPLFMPIRNNRTYDNNVWVTIRWKLSDYIPRDLPKSGRNILKIICSINPKLFFVICHMFNNISKFTNGDANRLKKVHSIFYRILDWDNILQDPLNIQYPTPASQMFGSNWGLVSNEAKRIEKICSRPQISTCNLSKIYVFLSCIEWTDDIPFHETYTAGAHFEFFVNKPYKCDLMLTQIVEHPGYFVGCCESRTDTFCKVVTLAEFMEHFGNIQIVAIAH